MSIMNAKTFDLVIIGGGINGCGIARDAAGRGWTVLLCEQGDLAGATSSASTKLIHGGLRYLEHREFRLVREALLEREVLWGIAPHIIWPLRFVLPHHRGLRPKFLLRMGLFLYDHLGGRRLLPPTRTVDLTSDPVGAALKPVFTSGFEYSDCWVEDSRLVVLNARDAADRGAEILTRTQCVSAVRGDGVWRVELANVARGTRREVTARTLVNAAGPWVGSVLEGVLRANVPARVRLVQGSHIVVPRLYAHDRCYIFQNADGRIFFALPYEGDFTLIGTTDLDYTGDPGAVQISEGEERYLCAGASEYFRAPVTPAMVVWRYSGVRPLYDDGASAAQAATRDYVLTLDAPEGQPAALSVFGGKITTFRRLAEAALAKRAPHLPPGRAAGWTGSAPLPGGDFPCTEFEALVASLMAKFPFLDPGLLQRLARAYGTRVAVLLGGVRSEADMGENFGAGLSAAEVRYLARHEWARTAADVVWRRSKLGLRLTAGQIAAIDRFLAMERAHG